MITNNEIVDASKQYNCPSSQQRGHIIVYKDDAWRYADTMDLAGFDNDRPCKKCNLPATLEGYDGCIGYLEGVDNACCGHGLDCGYVQVDGETMELHKWIDSKYVEGIT